MESRLLSRWSERLDKAADRIARNTLEWATTLFTVFLCGLSVYALIRGTVARPANVEPTVAPALAIFIIASILLAKDLSNLVPEENKLMPGLAKWAFLGIGFSVAVIVDGIWGNNYSAIIFMGTVLIAYL